MGKNYCAVKDCHNVSGRIGRFGKSVKLHELPKKQHLRTAWLRAISRKHFNPKRTRGRISLSKLEAHINRRHLTCYKNALSSTNQDPHPSLPPLSFSPKAYWWWTFSLEARTNRRHLTSYKKRTFFNKSDPLPCLPPLSLSLS